MGRYRRKRDTEPVLEFVVWLLVGVPMMIVSMIGVLFKRR